MYVLNHSEMQELDSFQALAVPENCFKNFRFEKAIGLVSNEIKQIISCMYDNILDKRKYQYVDVKYHDLSPGQSPANGLWHLDSSLNADHYYENYLWVNGKHNLTEYVDNEVVVPRVKTSKEFNDIVNQQRLEINRVKSNTVTRFYGDRIHRSPLCEVAEPRILVRLVNTDRKLPTYKIKL